MPPHVGVRHGVAHPTANAWERPMTDQKSPTSTDEARSRRSGPVDLTARTDRSDALMGWVRFGAVIMTVIGAFAVIEGLLALLRPTTYLTVNGTVLALDLSAWGWVHLILGALLAITGVSLLREAPPWARGLGVLLVALSTVVQMAWLPAYPIWSILMIALAVIVIYALAATTPQD
jgi:hypothetical protein